MQIARFERACECLCIRIEQQLVRVEPMALHGLIRAMNTVAVKLSRPCSSEVAVPDVFGAFRQRKSFSLASVAGVEQAELDLLGMRRKDCEICSFAIERCTKGL